MRTRSQELAERAYSTVVLRKGERQKEYLSFSRSFPTLLHTCGLAQSVAYADAKGGAQTMLLEDLAKVLETDRQRLLEDARKASLGKYMRLNRDALAAAGWLKRYAEALLDDEKDSQQ